MNRRINARIERNGEGIQITFDSGLLFETNSANRTLSEQRAEAVTNLAKGLGVKGSRFTTIGDGETQPPTSNANVAGRQENRRVEVAAMANDDLKNALGPSTDGRGSCFSVTES